MLRSRFMIVAIISSLLLVGCSLVDRWVYRPDINQGNYITQDAVDKLRLGQTKEQVVYIMGSPMLTSVFGDDIWYYVFHEKPQHGYVRQKTYSITFSRLGQVIDIKESSYRDASLNEADEDGLAKSEMQ